MQTDRQLTIYTARSRKSALLQEMPTSGGDLFSRLSNSQTIPLTHDAYTALPKAKQDAYKDVGGFIGGTLRGGRRRSGCVLARGAVVLDADNIPANGADDFIRRVKALDLCGCVYSTAKHSPASPRLRVVFILAQDIPADMYAPVARLMCRRIQEDLTWFDPSTDQSGRLMYWPSHCSDVVPVYQTIDGPLANADTLLEQYLPSWRDPASWPRFPREQAPAKLAAKQGDPTTKTGVVGAFCRAYSVPEAINEYLPGIYEETATEGRYTFAEGSTWGGAILYDDGKFLFSHHATDPAGGRLVNAFDLVRLHRFSELDDSEDVREGTPPGRMPSYLAMCELAQQDTTVKDELAREALASAKADFQDDDAALELGRYAKSQFDLCVLRAALQAMGVQIRRNLITGKMDITGMPPQYSQEEAVNTLPVLLWDLMKPLKIKGGNITAIQKGLSVLADEDRFNPVLDMLRGTAWDGMNRLPVLLDILHIDGESFYALLIRKWLIQSVAMAHNTTPGYLEAAEGVLTLQGDQGLGKTMFFRKLAIKPEWFAEGVTLDMKNKDTILQATCVWLSELGELESTLRKEQPTLKSFLTQKVDRIRAPYAPEATDRPRHTSFGASVNPVGFLKDDTGDRRFWVVPIQEIDLDTLLQLGPDWFAQLWAEVYIWWMRDPQGFRLSRMEREHLNEMNQQYRELIPGEEEIRMKLNWDLLAAEWRDFTASQLKEEIAFLDRTTVQQIGRVLAKLAREDNRIQVSENRHRVKTYRLPIPSDFADTDDTDDTDL